MTAVLTAIRRVLLGTGSTAFTLVGALVIGLFVGLTFAPWHLTGGLGDRLGALCWHGLGAGAVLLPVLGVGWALAAFGWLGSPSTGRAAAPVGADKRAQLSQVRRLAVARERHHLVLVRRAAEAEMCGQLLVQKPERVRQCLCSEHVEAAAGEPPGEVRRALAATVHHQHVARVHT